ncbi:MAG: hypothetical protein R3E94_19965 [Burkholderiaceae bacterium]
MNADHLDLFLFETSAPGAAAMHHAGVQHLLVDWEYMGKTERQQGFDTEIAPQDRNTLRDIVRSTTGPVWCRINRSGEHTRREIEEAIEAGASGLFLPMVQHPSEVEAFLGMIDGRCESGILVETTQAMTHLGSLAKFPLSRVYFGLNDFAISRSAHFIFRAVLDGSVQRAREAFEGIPFGFAGVTAIDRGSPVPCAWLVEEMERLGCQFSFMRRSFRRDVRQVSPGELVDGVQAYWRQCRARDPATRQSDHHRLHALLAELDHADPTPA